MSNEALCGRARHNHVVNAYDGRDFKSCAQRCDLCGQVLELSPTMAGAHPAARLSCPERGDQ
jgi:hypothetical protein